jgi:tRNA/rRNA methyltransferase
VLVRPQGGENVGSVCRAIKNMGGGKLVVVAPEFDEAGAVRMAVHADDVYRDRTEAPDLATALEGCALVIGTTARKGAYRDRASDIRELCERAATDAQGRIDDTGALSTAFVFGPEDSGLNNDDIASCHELGFIPSSDEYLSLNLAQAVVVTLYEFRRARMRVGQSEITVSPRPQSDAGDVDAMFAQLERALAEIGFLSSDNPAHIMLTLRSMLTRAGMDPRELSILRGIARQIDWYANGGREVAMDKRRQGEKLR